MKKEAAFKGKRKVSAKRAGRVVNSLKGVLEESLVSTSTRRVFRRGTGEKGEEGREWG